MFRHAKTSITDGLVSHGAAPKSGFEGSGLVVLDSICVDNGCKQSSRRVSKDCQ